MERIIILCEIARIGFRNEVNVTYDDDSSEILFDYYPDELSFSEREFVGLTRGSAMELFWYRDVTYLRS